MGDAWPLGKHETTKDFLLILPPSGLFSEPCGGAADQDGERVPMPCVTLDMFQTSGAAMLLLVPGRFLTKRSEFLSRCRIPAPVVGGLLFSLAHLALYMAGRPVGP